MNYEKELTFAKALALEAGEIGRRYFSNGIAYENKSDNSPVTLADTQINDLVITKCLAEYPESGVLGEEASQAGKGHMLWVCDPIDGTFPYALGLPASTFCLALVVDGVPEVGVVYDFNNGQLYSAIRGQQAYMNDKPIVPSTEQPMPVINLEWFHAAKYNLQGTREKLFTKGFHVPNYSSCDIMAMRVATGRIAGVIYAGDKSWDVAAAKVVVEACGGRVTDLTGHEQRYDGDIKGAIIAHPGYHDILLKATEA